MTDKVDDFLQHYGVLGMKWGKSSGGSGGSSSRATAAGAIKEVKSGSRADLRAKNKTAKSEAKAAADKKVFDARDRLGSDAQAYQKAKQQYKVDKHTVGKVKARQALDEVEAKYMKTWDEAATQTSKEKTQYALAAVGGFLLVAGLNTLANAS